MPDEIPHSTAKVHPATREVLPNDPMEMHGFEVSGDPSLMLRLLVEEYARIGRGAAEILQLARDPNYRTFHGLLQCFGEEEFAAQMEETLSRCGIIRVTVKETAPIPERLVQIETP